MDFNRKLYRCLDHLYTLFSIIENRQKTGKQTFICYVDARKAFDSVNRTLLWYKIHSLGIRGKFYCALKSLYTTVSCNIKINGCYIDWFDVNKAVKYHQFYLQFM
jgi:hypothetical protein